MAMRFSVDNDTFAHIEHAFPETDRWVVQGAGLAGRTGEMISLVDAGLLASNLAGSGLSDDEIARFGDLAGRHLQAALPTEVFQRLADKISFLAPAGR